MNAGEGERRARRRRTRAGRAGVMDLVVWDALLLGAAVGLVFVERALPARMAAAPPLPSPPVVASTPPTSTPPTTRPRGAFTRPGRVGSDPTPATSTPSTPPATTTPPATPTPEELERRAHDALAALSTEAHALVEAGRLEEAVALYTRAPAELKVSRAWVAEAGPAVQRLEGDLARADAWRAALPALETLADAGRPDEVEARVALLPVEARDVPRVVRERARAKARAGRAPAGFQIRGFTPDAQHVEGRRCVVEGEGERSRVDAVRDATDVVLAQAEGFTGWRRDAPLTVKLLAEDAPVEAPAASAVAVHARADEPAPDLVARARFAVARFALTRGPSDAPGGPAHGTAWVREGLAQVAAFSEPNGAERPSLTPLGQAARRRALVLCRALSPDALTAHLAGKAEVDSALAFGLCWAAGHQDERLRPLEDAVRSTLDALARGEPPKPKTPTPDEVRALVAALGETLEHP